MPHTSLFTSRILTALLVLFLTAQASLAGSASYHHSVSVGADGTPSLQLTNDSQQPIVAFMMVEFPSLGMEGRTYYDFYTNPDNLPIAPGASVTRGLSYFRGFDMSKVRAEVRGVIFQDGSTAGDSVWVNALLARRLRFYDRTLALFDTLSKQVGSRTTREGIFAQLRAAQDKLDKELPDDELRSMDDIAFYGAIRTIDKNREAKLDVVLKRYLVHLQLRAAQLERSQPSLDTIRSLSAGIPKPLSSDSLPADLQERLTQSSNAPTSLSQCQAQIPFSETTVPALTCRDSDNDVVTKDTSYTFSVTFNQYNATTGKTTPIPWTSGASPFKAVGVCYQFNDCDNIPDVYLKQGLAFGAGAALTALLPGSPAVTAKQGGNAILFYWMLDHYASVPTFSHCDACDLCPTCGENPVSSDPQIPTTYWYFSYACTIT